MCATCGCSDETGVSIVNLAEAAVGQDPSGQNGHPSGSRTHGPDGHTHGPNGHTHGPDGHTHGPDGHTHGPDGHSHGPDGNSDGLHNHHPGAPEGNQDRLIVLEQQVLAKNDLLAERNRGWLEARQTLAINLMSSPGSGKTTLLERTIRETAEHFSISVVEGDQATLIDANRIRATGCQVVQVNTGAGCHLDADMVHRALRSLDPPSGAVVVIENVGNLVCPALFDLGEDARVVVVSVTEGQDKPLKYPHMFRKADLILLNKIDLLPYVDFDVDAFIAGVRAVRPAALVQQLSARTGAGMTAWYEWLARKRSAGNGESTTANSQSATQVR
jgi:hydrogenase nickel incorporation protein HypB